MLLSRRKCILLGIYIASSGNSVLTFRDNLTALSSGVKNQGLLLGLRQKLSGIDFENGWSLVETFIHYIYIYIIYHITWTLWAVDQKHLKRFEMWCWRRMEKIIWTDHVRNEEVLLRVKGQRNILHEIRKWKANWIGHILRRNCLLQRVIEGKVQEE